MFGLLGVLGALMAGFLVDALSMPVGDDAEDHAPNHDPDHASEAEPGNEWLGSLLDDPGDDNTPAAGMPVSDDLAVADDPDETLAGDSGNDILAA